MALFETTFPPYVPFGSRTLSLQTPQQRGTDVAVFQAVYNLMLQTMNPPLGPIGSPITLDGIFGPNSRQAAINIQSYFGLSPDGVVGPNTFFVFGQGVGAHVTYGGPAFGSRTLSLGMTGGDVTVLQNRLNCFRYASLIGHPANGIFDAATATAVLAFKQDAQANGQTGLTPDSNVGSGTFDAFWLYTFLGGRGILMGRNGFDVVFLQVLLTNLGYYSGRITGYYDPATIAAVKAFQTASGITADGVVGQQTCYQLGLQNAVAAPSPLGIAWPPAPPSILPCCIVLFPTDVVLPIQPYVRGSSLHYVGARPQLLRPGVWAVVATLLPDPTTFGNFDHYQAVLFEPGGIAFVLDLNETPDGAWAGQMVNVISATITANFRVQIRLANSSTSATGPTVLRGSLEDCA
ncbi:MAG: peptidoglycan-binding protein [Thermaerobacter sp.]|nr:peptidoglycan-binding protein [Thermaerobacter sp.]